MGLLTTKTQTEETGQDLLAEINALAASVEERATTRNEVVAARLAELEAEQADLRQAQRKAAAIQQA